MSEAPIVLAGRGHYVPHPDPAIEAAKERLEAELVAVIAYQDDCERFLKAVHGFWSTP